MSADPPTIAFDLPFDAAVDKLTEQVTGAGLTVMRTFDLQVARRAQTACPCPHHGTEQCDCRMVVLLVYQVNHQPVTLLAHGYNGQTWFSVVNTPQQRADPAITLKILKELVPEANSADY